MTRRVVALAAIALAGAAGVACVAASSRDGAVIVDSGSTNTAGYRIRVWSDGTASLTIQNRAGVAQSGAKPFTIPLAQAQRFFADLKAARSGNAAGEPCMKSASFGTTTRIMWHGWTSPDLACPPGNAAAAALVHDVAVIRTASGVSTTFHRLPVQPMRVTPSMPSPDPSSSS